MAAKSQINKFRETARALETNESEATFNAALKAVAKAPVERGELGRKDSSKRSTRKPKR